MPTRTPCGRATRPPAPAWEWRTRREPRRPARRATQSGDGHRVNEMTLNRRTLLLAAAAAAAVALWLVLGGRTRAAENELAGNGTVEATEIEVGAQRPARLLRILVKEGDRVKQGQLLAELAPGEPEAEAQR